MKPWTALCIAAIFATHFSDLSGQHVGGSLPNLPLPPVPIFGANGVQYSSQDRSSLNKSIIDSDIRAYYERREAQANSLVDQPINGETENSTIRYSFPERNTTGRDRYERCFNLLSAMIRGDEKIDLMKAVFSVEQAFDTTLLFSNLDAQIQQAVHIIGEQMRKGKMDPSDNTAKVMAIFQYMADTIEINSGRLEKRIISYPKLYDFEDFWGRQDHRNMFVSKLLKSNSGQCHSLPLLFLILAEQIDAEAYLSFAPNHSFIKFKDARSKWHNIELTNGMLASDHFMVQSGYIKAEAIQSKVYLEPVTRKETIAQCLNDLAISYIKEFGYDIFVKRCTNVVLSHFENNLTAHQINANYYASLSDFIVLQYRTNGWARARLEKDTEAMKVINSAVGAGKRIEQLGYADMPEDAYKAWLNSVKNEIERRRHESDLRGLNTMIGQR